MTEYQFRLEQEIIKLKSQLEDANYVIRHYNEHIKTTMPFMEDNIAQDYLDKYGHKCLIYSIDNLKKEKK